MSNTNIHPKILEDLKAHREEVGKLAILALNACSQGLSEQEVLKILEQEIRNLIKGETVHENRKIRTP